MKKNNLKRFLASLLAVLMLSQVTGVAPGVFADFGESSKSGIATQAARIGEKITLNGTEFTIQLPYDDEGNIVFDTLYRIIFKKCVNVSESKPANLTYKDVKIGHEVTPGVYDKLEGTTSLSTIKPGTYKIKISATSLTTINSTAAKTCTITFLGRQTVPEIAHKDITVDASFNEDLSINYDALREAIWDQVSVDLPENVKFDKVSFEYKYNDTLNLWEAFEGKNIVGDKGIPALDLGANQVKLTWGGDGLYEGFKQEITVNVVDGRTDTSITFVEDRTVNIPFTETGIDYEAVKESIWALVDTITPADISKDSITVKYEGTDINDNPAISEGNHTLNFSYAGSANYKPFSTDVPVNFIDNRIVAFAAKERPDNLSRGYVGNTLDEAKTLEKAREELVTALKDVPLSEIKVEYKFAGNYIPLDINGIRLNLTDINKTDIRVSYAGNATYKAFSAEFKDLYFADNRVASSIAIKDGASITFNMSADNMKQQIFDNVIDWDSENTKLPAKDTLSIADFKFEIGLKDIADKDGYPNLDAGNGQTIKISFVGNSEFKPCNDVEATIDVAKADVKVTMKSFSTAHAGNDSELTRDKLNVKLDPNDSHIDTYLVFTGVNTDLQASVNLVLTDEQWKVIEKISNFQKGVFELAPDLFKDKATLKDKLESGITIKEFKEYLNSFVNALEKATKVPIIGDGINDLITKYGISIETLKAMATIFDNLTKISDNTKIAMGAPEHAGIYQVWAIAINKNYNTGVASGTVMILMNVKDMKIQLNSNFSKKMTVAQAKALAEDPAGVATLLCGTKPVGNPNLHYLYTGVQSNLKPYSSTTDFPTAPGRYVVTIVTLGGDYLAPPVTKTFQITK